MSRNIRDIHSIWWKVWIKVLDSKEISRHSAYHFYATLSTNVLLLNGKVRESEGYQSYLHFFFYFSNKLKSLGMRLHFCDTKNKLVPMIQYYIT